MELISTPVRADCVAVFGKVGVHKTPVDVQTSTPKRCVDHTHASTPVSTPILTSDSTPFCSKRRERLNSASAANKNVGKSSPGRFIPRRFSLDLDAANYLVHSSRSPSTDWSGEVFEDGLTWGSQSVRQQRRRLACLSEGASERRILNFGNEPKASEDKERFPEKGSWVSTHAKPERRLPRYPEKILDLPKLEDDFFTHSMCWSSSGYLVAGLESRLYICSAGTGTIMLNTLAGMVKYLCVACNAKGTMIAAGTNDGEIQIWDIASRKMIRTFIHRHYPFCGVRCLEWHPITNKLASGCSIGLVNFWDHRVEGVSEGLSGRSRPQSSVCGLRYSPNAAYLAISTGNHVIEVWDASSAGNRKPIFHKDAHASAIRALAWYPFRNNILASGGGIDDGHIRIWNVQTGDKLEEIYVQAQVCELVWSPETKELISSQSIRDQHSVVVWSYPGLQKVGNLPGHTGRVLHMAMSPCKTQLATAGADETLRIWQITKPRPKEKRPIPFATTSLMKGIR